MSKGKSKGISNMCEEIWKDITGFESLYQVSNLGRVRALHFGGHKERRIGILKLINSSTGYYVVNLFKDGKYAQRYIHRLVADAFIPNPGGKPVVDHINTNAKDNRVDNLRWATIKENVNNPISAKRRIDKTRHVFLGKSGAKSYVARRVVQKDLQGNVIRIWDCMSDAWKSFGLDSGAITHCCKGERKTAGGYCWDYAE